MNLLTKVGHLVEKKFFFLLKSTSLASSASILFLPFSILSLSICAYYNLNGLDRLHVCSRQTICCSFFVSRTKVVENSQTGLIGGVLDLMNALTRKASQDLPSRFDFMYLNISSKCIFTTNLTCNICYSYFITHKIKFAKLRGKSASIFDFVCILRQVEIVP